MLDRALLRFWGFFLFRHDLLPISLAKVVRDRTAGFHQCADSTSIPRCRGKRSGRQGSKVEATKEAGVIHPGNSSIHLWSRVATLSGVTMGKSQRTQSARHNNGVGSEKSGYEYQSRKDMVYSRTSFVGISGYREECLR